MEKISIVLKALECPLCFDYMLNEIRLCVQGHSICKNCKDKLISQGCPICKRTFGEGRNYALEDVAAGLTYPCRNEGCFDQLDSKNILKHEKTLCQQISKRCALYFTECTWNGPTSKLKEHVETRHKEYINNWISCELHDIEVWVTIDMDEIFVVVSKNFDFDDLIKYSAMYMGVRNNASDYLLHVKISDKGTGYQTFETVSCIGRLDIENVFAGDSIQFYMPVLTESFKNMSNKTNVQPSIIPL